MPTSVIISCIPDCHQSISSSWHQNSWTELANHMRTLKEMTLILLGSSLCTSTDLMLAWWPRNVDNSLHKQFTSHNLRVLSADAVFCNQIIIKNGMLTMLWSSIKIAVPYLRRHSNRSVLVLRCLLADHTRCWHN